jgi:hypothetical protein
MAKSGYIEVEVSERVAVSDVINEVDDDVLLEEVHDRGLFRNLQDPPTGFDYFSLCSHLGMNHHTPIKILIDKLEQELLTTHRNIIK